MNTKLSIILTLAVGLLLGAVGSQIFSYQKTDKNVVPLPVEFLTSTALESVSANIEGNIQTIGKDTITVNSSGNMTVLWMEDKSGITSFDEVRPEGTKTISFSNLSLGDHVRGGVNFILKDQASGARIHKKGDVIAHHLNVIKK